MKEDKEVGWEHLRTTQKELNGHMSMLIKILVNRLRYAQSTYYTRTTRDGPRTKEGSLLPDM